MDALLLAGQAVALSALAYGCYLCIPSWNLRDEQGIEGEFGAMPGVPSSGERYDPLSDARVTADIGSLL